MTSTEYYLDIHRRACAAYLRAQAIVHRQGDIDRASYRDMQAMVVAREDYHEAKAALAAVERIA